MMKIDCGSDAGLPKIWGFPIFLGSPASDPQLGIYDLDYIYMQLRLQIHCGTAKKFADLDMGWILCWGSYI